MMRRGGIAMRLLWLSLISMLLMACEPAAPPEPPPRFKEIFHLNTFEKDFGYAQAVKVGHTLYVSGVVAVDTQGRLVAPDDIAGQLKAAYHNLEVTLRAHNAGFDHVVKENIYTTDMDALLKAADLRFVYYSKEGLPASTWVQVERLVDPRFLIEIEVIAELP
jgi:2-iminobutanoate/2-iminopropanoate deaminase